MVEKYYSWLDPYWYDPKKKRDCTDLIVGYMIDRTQSMFKWSGLPESIPQRVLELYLQLRGHCCFYEYEGTLYVFTGGLGGKPDVYYMPTIYTIANPALEITKNLEIDKECIVASNDSLYTGLFPLFKKYAAMLTETELSINVATINSRIIDLISAPDDRTKTSAEKYLKDVEDGKLGVIAENAFLDGIRTQPYGNTGNSNNITNLIELNQYQKASFFNEIGLDANYNMKRESLNSSESLLNKDALLPLIDDMLKCRKIAAEKVNVMFGTEISVEFASSWEDNAEELEAAQEAQDEQKEDPAADPEEEPTEEKEDEEIN